MPKARVHDLTPKQLAAIATPLRQRMFTTMVALGEFSVAELADEMERSASALYYHLKALLEVGLVLEVGVAATGRRHTKVYAPIAKRVRVVQAEPRAANLAAMQKSVRATFRSAERGCLAALALPDCQTSGSGRNMQLQQFTARLSKKRLREISDKLKEIDALLHAAQQEREGDTYTVTNAFHRG
jgi:DNA-binding transcriptional ArsR family regulator